MLDCEEHRWLEVKAQPFSEGVEQVSLAKKGREQLEHLYCFSPHPAFKPKTCFELIHQQTLGGTPTPRYMYTWAGGARQIAPALSTK